MMASSDSFALEAFSADELRYLLVSGGHISIKPTDSAIANLEMVFYLIHKSKWLAYLCTSKDCLDLYLCKFHKARVFITVVSFLTSLGKGNRDCLAYKRGSD